MSDELVLKRLNPIPTRQLKRELSLEKLWELFVGLKGEISKSRQGEYNRVKATLLPYLRRHGFSPASIVRLQPIFKAGISNNSANKMLSITRSFMRFLHTMRYTGEDLSNVVISLKPDPIKNAEVFTDEEYSRIQAYCLNKPHFQPHLWLITLAYRTGMSLIDCCYLRWKDVKLNENSASFIEIRRKKNARFGDSIICRIPIIPGTDVHEWLKKLKSVEHLNYKRADGITDYVHQDCPGLYECRFQTIGNLRNTFCSNLVNSGAQTALIMNMTGHTNVKTLLRYLKVDIAEMQNQLDKAFNYAAQGQQT